MKKAFSLGFAYVGTVIGAGFATGREILLYFGECSFLSVLLAGLFLGVFCYVILRLSSVYGSVFKAFGIFEKPIRVFVFLSNFCVLCATISGAESVLFSSFSFHGGGIVFAVFSLLIVLWGVQKVKLLNVLAVPVIIILVCIVFFKSDFSLPSGKYSVFKPFFYASMNVITGGFLIGNNSGSVTKKESLVCSLLSGFVLTALLFFIRVSAQNVSAQMPFLAKAESLGLTIVGRLVLLLAMLTTVIGTLSVCSFSNKYLALLVTSLALLLSTFGFESIVDAAYPIMGAVGGAISVGALGIFLLSLSPKFSRYYNRLFRPNGSLCPRRLRRGN